MEHKYYIDFFLETLEFIYRTRNLVRREECEWSSLSISNFRQNKINIIFKRCYLVDSTVNNLYISLLILVPISKYSINAYFLPLKQKPSLYICAHVFPVRRNDKWVITVVCREPLTFCCDQVKTHITSCCANTVVILELLL